MSAPDDVIAWLRTVLHDPAKANRRIAVEYPLDERKGIAPRFVAERYIPDLYSQALPFVSWAPMPLLLPR